MRNTLHDKQRMQADCFCVNDSWRCSPISTKMKGCTQPPSGEKRIKNRTSIGWNGAFCILTFYLPPGEKCYTSTWIIMFHHPRGIRLNYPILFLGIRLCFQEPSFTLRFFCQHQHMSNLQGDIRTMPCQLAQNHLKKFRSKTPCDSPPKKKKYYTCISKTKRDLFT